MDEILNTRIKEVISRYPEVGTVLSEFGVACVTCAVGTCLLKDILDIHRFAPEDEQRMMTRIAGIIYPGRSVVVPLRKTAPTPKTKALVYSPPLQAHVDEHKLIKRLLVLIPAMVRSLDLDSEEGCQLALCTADFIRSFADKYHHAKEEDILFKNCDEATDIINVMLSDHEAGRAHVRAILDAVERRDTANAAEHLKAYGALLTEHIKREDEVLYPWLDGQLSDTQVGRLFDAFNEADGRASDTRRRCEAFIQRVEHRFGDATPQTGELSSREGGLGNA
jgi:hemerythrin-like domain-containing protein